MRLCELKQKEVINICDCRRLGYVGDVDFDVCTGRILALIVPGPGCLWGFLGRESEWVIPWCDIKQIGDISEERQQHIIFTENKTISIPEIIITR